MLLVNYRRSRAHSLGIIHLSYFFFRPYHVLLLMYSLKCIAVLGAPPKYEITRAQVTSAQHTTDVNYINTAAPKSPSEPEDLKAKKRTTPSHDIFYANTMDRRCMDPEENLEAAPPPEINQHLDDPEWNWRIDPSTTKEEKLRNMERWIHSCKGNCRCDEVTGELRVGASASPWCRPHRALNPASARLRTLAPEHQNPQSILDAFNNIPGWVRAQNPRFTWDIYGLSRYNENPFPRRRTSRASGGTVWLPAGPNPFMPRPDDQPPAPGLDLGDGEVDFHGLDLNYDLDQLHRDLNMHDEYAEVPPFGYVSGWEFTGGSKPSKRSLETTSHTDDEDNIDIFKRGNALSDAQEGFKVKS
ncbi:hypothetical protein TWF481_010711 [Arthrobotrys musiformis]|uniref:Uncharacterized protein n=1 Tax=Arthrobotrys musiformis TaxID=47236 RepID=A0AAV9W3K8_9PEZI